MVRRKIQTHLPAADDGGNEKCATTALTLKKERGRKKREKLFLSVMAFVEREEGLGLAREFREAPEKTSNASKGKGYSNGGKPLPARVLRFRHVTRKGKGRERPRYV